MRSNKLEISFNEQNLHFEGPPVLKAVEAWPEGDKNEIIEWKKTISFSVSNGASVSGFVAIREKGSFAQAGLSLFRRNRLIEGSDEDKYKPKEIFKEANSFQSLRIFGELHLEGFEVSHTLENMRKSFYIFSQKRWILILCQYQNRQLNIDLIQVRNQL